MSKDFLDDPEQDWENAMWSDETRIELFDLTLVLPFCNNSIFGSLLVIIRL